LGFGAKPKAAQESRTAGMPLSRETCRQLQQGTTDNDRGIGDSRWIVLLTIH
jgi:hypothetical protein